MRTRCTEESILYNCDVIFSTYQLEEYSLIVVERSRFLCLTWWSDLA
ncbi:hypothetical protein NDA02_23620 [Leptolyngbya sp. ST-U4]